MHHVAFSIVQSMVVKNRDESEGPGTFIGYASVFDSRTAIGDPNSWGWYEEVDSGAFDGALSRPDDVRFLYNHDTANLLARTSSGTLRLSTDKRGLKVEADLPNTSLGRDLMVMLERRDLDGMSFGFVPTKIEWSTLDDGTELARILDIDPLLEVSAVAFPAYKDTDAAARTAYELVKRSNPLAAQRRAAALERHAQLSPPPGMTKKERNA